MLTDIWDLMYPRDFNVLLVKRGNQIVAGVGFCASRETSKLHLMYGAFDNTLPARSSIYLFACWKTIVWSYENGFKELDFGPTVADSTNRNYRFKEQFGGRFVKKYRVKIEPFRILSNPLIKRIFKVVT